MTTEVKTMAVETHRFEVSTKGKGQIIDITSFVAGIVERSSIKSGTVTVFIPGSTAGLTTIEYESGLVKDFTRFWDRAVPDDVEYSHNQKWHDNNGHSHVRSSLLGPSLTVPFTDKKLLIGIYQQIILVDFDVRSREREIICQLMGEN
ncbi:MAG: secondary thiamine-phosphate synthase enzyme YjbQ [Armatimonadota bacterium]